MVTEIMWAYRVSSTGRIFWTRLIIDETIEHKLHRIYKQITCRSSGHPVSSTMYWTNQPPHSSEIQSPSSLAYHYYCQRTRHWGLVLGCVHPFDSSFICLNHCCHSGYLLYEWVLPWIGSFDYSTRVTSSVLVAMTSCLMPSIYLFAFIDIINSASQIEYKFVIKAYKLMKKVRGSSLLSGIALNVVCRGITQVSLLCAHFLSQVHNMLFIFFATIDFWML